MQAAWYAFGQPLHINGKQLNQVNRYNQTHTVNKKTKTPFNPKPHKLSIFIPSFKTK
jgi:hypothetical protein